MKFPLVIFDCDGTLVESEHIACKVFPNYWATHGVRITADEFKERFIGAGSNAPVVTEMFSKLPAHARDEGDRLFDEALRKELVPVTGMVDLVASLPSKICVASNSSLAHIREVLTKTELSKFFGRNLFSAQTVPRPKPAPDLFHLAASTLQFDAADCIVVEDSVPGINAAKNAGMKVIGFSGAKHFVPSLAEKLKQARPDFLCSSTEELRKMLIPI